jgi:hypothetical protein
LHASPQQVKGLIQAVDFIAAGMLRTSRYIPPEVSLELVLRGSLALFYAVDDHALEHDAVHQDRKPEHCRRENQKQEENDEQGDHRQIDRNDAPDVADFIAESPERTVFSDEFPGRIIRRSVAREAGLAEPLCGRMLFFL